MRKSVSLLLTLCLLLGLCACGGADAATGKTELVVFAASSLTETLTEIGDAYMAEHENITLVFNFDSSGTLKTQIQEGACCDIFLSAGQSQMDALDCVLPGSRFDLLENKVVLAVPQGNPAGIGSFGDLKTGLERGELLLAMGNADVPVGQYTRKILAHLGLSEEALAANGVLTYGSNVKEVTVQVTEAAVDCGILYATDAFSAGLTVADTATAEMCGQVIYPAAILSISENREAAEAFMTYLTGDAADRIFEGVGFTPLA